MPLFFVDELDVQFLAAAAKSGAAAAGDDAGAQPGGNGKSEALPVVSVEGFAFERMAILLRDERHTTVGQRAVHVHEQDENLFRSSCQFFRDFLCSRRQCHLLYF